MTLLLAVCTTGTVRSAEPIHRQCIWKEGVVWKKEPGNETPRDQLEAARKRAQAAAGSSNTVALFEELCSPGLLDGIWRWVRSRWSRLSDDEVDVVVSKAVDELLAAVHRGQQVDDVLAYIGQTAITVGGHHNAATEAPVRTFVDDDEIERREELAANRLRHGARIARRLLPRLGRGQIVPVMRYVIECIENDVPCTGPGEISQELGIPTATVRTLLWRGFDRLRTAASEEGLEDEIELIESVSTAATDEED
jgi:hypothetical protein